MPLNSAIIFAIRASPKDERTADIFAVNKNGPLAALSVDASLAPYRRCDIDVFWSRSRYPNDVSQEVSELFGLWRELLVKTHKMLDVRYQCHCGRPSQSKFSSTSYAAAFFKFLTRSTETRFIPTDFLSCSNHRRGRKCFSVAAIEAIKLFMAL